MATPVHILTLAIEDKAAEFFNQLRRQYFPPDRNFLEAHLTLFHYLPKPAIELSNDIRSMFSDTTAFTIKVIDVASIGKGVAYKLETAELQAIHKRLQQRWKPMLNPQDLQKLWPHITIQNKVSPVEAKQTLETLKADFQPFTFQAIGFSVWEYLNGPWKFVDKISFKSTF